jgi:hypothetical protein
MNPFNHSEEDAVKKLLQEAAEQIKPNAAFTANLEKQLKQTHRPKAGFNMLTLKKITSPIGWSLALIALALAFNWIASQIAPKTVPGSSGPTEQPAPFSEEGTPVPTPAGQVYEWNGQPIHLNAALPETPSDMKIYLQQNEVIARVEDVQTLAQKFGMNGEIYQVPGEVPNTTDFLMVDENQQLRVRSDRYFTYYPNYAEAMYAFNTQEAPDHEALIDSFMQTHELGSEYKIERSELYGGYIAPPLTPDGFTVRHEHFASNGYLFDFNGNGILRVRSSVLRYEEVATAAVIRAEEALDKLLDPSTIYGITSATHSPNPDGLSWRRVYPLDQTLTYYGFLRSTARSITGGPPLITLDEYQASGNVQNIPENMPNTFVEVTGQFHEQEGVRTFEVQTWEIYDGSEEGHQGTIQQQNGRAVFITMDGDTLNISDPPADISLPVEDVYITGVTRDGEFIWKSIDTRTMSGGGGGGGGLGFYKINLSGTPVPLPTNIPLPDTQLPQAESPAVEAPPTMSIEKVELAYFTPDRRYYAASEQADEPLYLQPVWIFSGHYSDGSEFQFIIQALKDEYLSPQIQPARAPG